MTTKRLAELDEHDHQLEQRMAELRDALAAVQGETVSAAEIRRGGTLRSGLGPAPHSRAVPRFRILPLLRESVGYDGATGELELAFYPLDTTSQAAEAAMVGQPVEVAA